MTEAKAVKKKRTRRGGPNARGELRRKELIDSAEALLLTRSVESVSYTDIADRASYCQVWCTRLMISGGLPPDRPRIDTVDEHHSGDNVCELPEAA